MDLDFTNLLAQYSEIQTAGHLGDTKENEKSHLTVNYISLPN